MLHSRFITLNVICQSVIVLLLQSHILYEDHFRNIFNLSVQSRILMLILEFLKKILFLPVYFTVFSVGYQSLIVVALLYPFLLYQFFLCLLNKLSILFFLLVYIFSSKRKRMEKRSHSWDKGLGCVLCDCDKIRVWNVSLELLLLLLSFVESCECYIYDWFIRVLVASSSSSLPLFISSKRKFLYFFYLTFFFLVEIKVNDVDDDDDDGRGWYWYEWYQ